MTKQTKQGWVDELYRLDVGDPDSKGCTISLGEYLRTDCPELEGFISDLLSLQREEVRREVVEEMKKTLDFGDLYVFDRELPRVEGIDEQGIRYKGMQVNIDKLDLSAREEKGVK